jgi:REP element-mobilizing transposase RayT
MRQARLKASIEMPVGYYHCISRVVDRAFVLGEEEKEVFTRMMREYERFYGVRVVSHCVMSNHFHILVEVPQRPGKLPSDDELLGLMRGIYSKVMVGTLRQQLQMLREEGATEEAERLRESFFVRMWDVSFFMKSLKQRFTQWFNRKHGRKGTLWEERFRSVLVEGSGESLATMAAYIDLNPVRAGMVSDPKDYRWSGYAEAIAGKTAAREGVAIVVEYLKGKQIRGEAMLSVYRTWLYGQGEESGEKAGGSPIKQGFNRKQIAEIVEAKGRLSRWEMLHCRVRYFADGAVIGSRGFVNAVFAANRGRYGVKRKDGARRMRGIESGTLYALRNLRINPIAPS